MMKRLAVAAVAAVVLGVPADAIAQESADANLNVSVNVLQGLTLTGGGTLDFGNQVTGAGETTIDAAADGIALEALGDGGRSIAVTFPATVSLNGAGEGLTFTPAVVASQTADGTFEVISTGDAVELSGSNFEAGSHSFRVGGTLQAIPQNQAAGAYTGSFLMTVAYTEL